jgi:hypothetical protein
MKSRSLRLSIVNFLGVFLSGTAWALLIGITLDLLGWSEFSNDPNPLSTARAMLGVSTGSQDGFSLGPTFYTSFALFSLLAGYLVKAVLLGSRPADWVTFHLASLGGLRPASRRERVGRYLEPIENIVDKLLGCHWRRFPGNQPFDSCKYLLRIYAPSLWEEAQQREAQIRCLESLTLASLYSLLPSFIYMLESGEIRRALNWQVVSCLISVLLARASCNQWFQNIEDIYLSTLITAPLTDLAEGESGTDVSLKRELVLEQRQKALHEEQRAILNRANSWAKLAAVVQRSALAAVEIVGLAYLVRSFFPFSKQVDAVASTLGAVLLVFGCIFEYLIWNKSVQLLTPRLKEVETENLKLREERERLTRIMLAGAPQGAFTERSDISAGRKGQEGK